MTSPPPPATVRRLAAAAFVASYDRVALATVLLLVAHDLGTSPGTIASVLVTYFLAYGLTQPAWGCLAERYGRVRAMRWGLLGSAATGIVSAAAPDPLSLAVSRGLTGGLMAAVIPCALMYIGDAWPTAQRQRPLSDVLAATSLGTAAGCVLAGALAELGTWRVAVAAGSVGAAGVWVVTASLPEPTHLTAAAHPLAGIRAVCTTRSAVVVLLLAFAEGAVLLGMFPFMAPALQAHGVTVGLAGLATSLFGVGVLVGAQVVKAALSRLGPSQMICAGGVGLVCGWSLLGVRIELGFVAGAALTLGFGWAFYHSSMQAWATEIAPTLRATAVSLFVTVLFAGAGLGSALGAPLADRGAYRTLFLITAVLCAALTVATARARARVHAP